MEELNHPCTIPANGCGFIDALKNCSPCLASKNTESLLGLVNLLW
jgi:hypothetical protein